MIKLTLLSIVVLLVAGSSAIGSDYFVSVSKGSDEFGDGSMVSPWKTIAYAKSKTSSSDIIKVAPGVYTETLIFKRVSVISSLSEFNKLQKRLTAEAKNPKCPFCNGSGKVECPICSGTGYKGFKITGIKCPTCLGTGKYKGKTCWACGGKGLRNTKKIKKKCERCKGKGKISCRRCGGDGLLGTNNEDGLSK